MASNVSLALTNSLKKLMIFYLTNKIENNVPFGEGKPPQVCDFPLLNLVYESTHFAIYPLFIKIVPLKK